MFWIHLHLFMLAHIQLWLGQIKFCCRQRNLLWLSSDGRDTTQFAAVAVYAAAGL